MLRVMIESPYKATPGRSIEDNLVFLDSAMRDSLRRGEAPFAMHLVYPRYLDDLDPKQRDHGILCGLTWAECADLVAVYCDHGITPGMALAMEWADSAGIPVVLRRVRF